MTQKLGARRLDPGHLALGSAGTKREPLMNSPLERLGELVRKAQAKSRVQKINAEIQQAAGQLRLAEERARKAEAWSREMRPSRQRELEQVDAEDQQLKELIRKAAQLKVHLEPDNDAEELILAAQRDIETRRREAQADLEAGTRELDESRRELRAALDQYQQLRRELDRLQPQLPEAYSVEDRLVAEAETFFPSGQLQALAREIEDGASHFGLLDQKEQYAQVKIWIGRYRRLPAAELSEEEQVLARQIFTRLVGISKEHQPGYIEAFQQGFTTDWDAFITEAQEQMQQATEARRRKRDLEQQQLEQQVREQERQRQAREAAQSAMEELKALIARVNLPEEGADEFRAVLDRVISGYGASEPDVLELVMPYRDLIDGCGEFRALRRNLDRLRQEEDKTDDAIKEEYADLVSATQGRRVLLIGGAAREDVRRALERIFNFEKLDWETYEDTKPVLLESMEQRVRNHGVDLVLILKSFIRHHVPERMRPLCEQHGIPCLMVEHGYGPAQVAEALRRGLLKDVGTRS